MSDKLAATFVVELYKSCLTDSKVLDICRTHLQYTYLESDAQKKLFKYVFDYCDVQNVLPTPGIIAQAFHADSDVLAFLKQVKDTTLQHKDRDNIISSFEEFIRKSKFVALFNSAHDLYQEGKQDEAISLVAQESIEIVDFQIKDSYYTTVFKDYEERSIERERVADDNINLNDKMPFGIRELDEITYGGIKRGTSALFLGQSGKGKTTVLRWLGIANARIGKRVVHFQIEGSKEECLEGYDAAWTASKLRDFEIRDFGQTSSELKKKILKARKDILANNGEIYIYAAESFDSMTIEQCRDIVIDIEKVTGKVDLIIFDYLEILDTKKKFGKTESSERKRREFIANKITDLGIELKAATATATQANDISPQDLKNPDFVMTRHHISEFKGTLKPFSYFLTINMTPDEERSDICRLYCDKFRRHPGGQTVMIAQKKDIGRFYDHERTMKDFYDEKTHSSIPRQLNNEANNR